MIIQLFQRKFILRLNIIIIIVFSLIIILVEHEAYQLVASSSTIRFAKNVVQCLVFYVQICNLVQNKNLISQFEVSIFFGQNLWKSCKKITSNDLHYRIFHYFEINRLRLVWISVSICFIFISKIDIISQNQSAKIFKKWNQYIRLQKEDEILFYFQSHTVVQSNQFLQFCRSCSRKFLLAQVNAVPFITVCILLVNLSCIGLRMYHPNTHLALGFGCFW